MRQIIYEALASLGQQTDFEKISALGERLGQLLWTVVPGRKKVATDAVRDKLGLDQAQADRLARESFMNNGRSFLELLLARRVDWRFAENRLTIEDPQRFDRIQSMFQGVPVVAATAHLGAWELLGGLLNLMAPQAHKQVVVKATHDLAMHRVITRMRTHSTVRIQEHDHAAKSVLRNLAKDGLSAFLVDHNCRREEAVFLTFLGCLAAVNVGPALLALRGKALVWPVFLVRNDGVGRYRLCFDDPLDTRSLTGERQDRIKQIAQFYTQAVERQVRKHPDQWFWMHRRWKTRPLNEGPDGQENRK
jgi:Kdo2-lipid IVA lauroyltransferase/acyltransferase